MYEKIGSEGQLQFADVEASLHTTCDLNREKDQRYIALAMGLFDE